MTFYFSYDLRSLCEIFLLPLRFSLNVTFVFDVTFSFGRDLFSIGDIFLQGPILLRLFHGTRLDGAGGHTVHVIATTFVEKCYFYCCCGIIARMRRVTEFTLES